jgi:hypothetical protein
MAPNISITIERATQAIYCERKHPHQNRISPEVLKLAQVNLQRCQERIRQCKDFHALFELVYANRIKGFGELATYDTAVRVGACPELKLEPEYVYLHAGTRLGAFALRSAGYLNSGFTRRTQFLEMTELPAELQELKPIEAEDFLCIYKDLKLKAENNEIDGCKVRGVVRGPNCGPRAKNSSKSNQPQNNFANTPCAAATPVPIVTAFPASRVHAQSLANPRANSNAAAIASIL